MEKIESDSPVTLYAGPNIESMYNLLYWTLNQWNGQTKLAIQGKEAPLLSSCKYSLILQVYTMLDAVIHSYVATNNFKTEKREDDMTVYSKWKNFPYTVENRSFKKEDILIIDRIRILRNQVAHPKIRVETVAESAEGEVTVEILDPETKEVKGFLNFSPRPQFVLKHGFFLVNETTRLITLVDDMLSETNFLPKKRAQMIPDAECWPDDVDVASG